MSDNGRLVIVFDAKLLVFGIVGKCHKVIGVFTERLKIDLCVIVASAYHYGKGAVVFLLDFLHNFFITT